MSVGLIVMGIGEQNKLLKIIQITVIIIID